MPSRRPPEPWGYRLPPPEEMEKWSEPPEVIAYDAATLTTRTLWQTWDRERGGWTQAVRLHPLLPLVKFSMSASLCFEDEPQDGHYWSGTCWIVEEHPRACCFWGEKGEIGLGQGDPLLQQELDPGWMNLRTNRVALSKGREHVESNLLAVDGREAYADLICADLITGNDDMGCGYRDDHEPLFGLWAKALQVERKSDVLRGLAQTRYLSAVWNPAAVNEKLNELVGGKHDFTFHEIMEAIQNPQAAKQILEAT